MVTNKKARNNAIIEHAYEASFLGYSSHRQAHELLVWLLFPRTSNL